MRLTTNCSICGKQLVLTDSQVLTFEDSKTPPTRLNFYKCGHFFSEEVTSTDFSKLDFRAADGSEKEAREYQRFGIKFIIDSNFNCIIGDQMRLGKTLQSLLAFKNKLKERKPALFLVRSANLWQWIREYKTWTSVTDTGIYPILTTKAFIPPGFDAYIMSMDTFSRTGVVDKLLKFGFKLVVVDEAHSFKNTQSNRSQALVKFLHDISEETLKRVLKLNCVLCSWEWDEESTIKVNLQAANQSSQHTHRTKCPNCSAYLSQTTARLEERRERKCGIVMLTGTAIKNRAEEYFVPLNLVAPTKFPSLANFQRTWLEKDSKGRYSHVRPYMLGAFKETIAPYVLRREKEDVYTDLPALNRIFTVIEPDSDALKASYNKILDQLDSKLAERANPTYWDLKDELMALRRICGLMKVPWTSDYLDTCIMDSDKQRYAVGLHHHDVRSILLHKLGSENCLNLSGSDSASQKDYIMTRFEHSRERILLINMVAGGVGMDFHYCDNVIILERQWSSADEEQFEFRFYNPDKSIKDRPTNIEYVLIKDSVEAFFYNMVEEKRRVFGETLGTNWNFTEDTRSFRDLVEQTVGARL